MKDVVLYENVAYLKTVELIRTDMSGKIIWHLKTPYAKLIDGTLILYSIEDNNPAVKYLQKLFIQRLYQRNFGIYPTTVSPEKFCNLEGNRGL